MINYESRFIKKAKSMDLFLLTANWVSRTAAAWVPQIEETDEAFST